MLFHKKQYYIKVCNFLTKGKACNYHLKETHDGLEGVTLAKTVKIVIVGFGNMGRSLARMLLEKAKYIQSKHSLTIVITGIIEVDYVLIDSSEKGLDLEEILSLKKLELINRSSNLAFEEVLDKLSFDIVVELTPSTENGHPGLEHIQKAFENKKHVVTSNKSPLVLKYPELKALADQNDREFRFEATVGGVIPLFTTVQSGLSANEILRIEGILNGTTNYILTRMSEGTTYSEAIDDAKKLGFCETNPHDDISGLDAARKLVIIADVLLDSNLTLDEVKIQGIDKITDAQIIESHLHNQVIKHIASIEINNDGIQGSVKPRSINLSNPLAHVNGIMNAIHVFTKFAGEITLFGIGAGPKEVATILLSDIISVGLKA
ncbi:MAG: homoserine dehydrogenase [Candidatus Helarchaeota archaeon]|nr:homoserine dehydrogenase [Candidatus Helarchaeota archaeon]